MQKIEEMQKRPYSKPKIVAVKLNHEQAVLSQCAVDAGTLAQGIPAGYCRPGVNGCRQKSSAGGTDSDATS